MSNVTAHILVLLGGFAVQLFMLAAFLGGVKRSLEVLEKRQDAMEDDVNKLKSEFGKLEVISSQIGDLTEQFRYLRRRLDDFLSDHK